MFIIVINMWSPMASINVGTTLQVGVVVMI